MGSRVQRGSRVQSSGFDDGAAGAIMKNRMQSGCIGDSKYVAALGNKIRISKCNSTLGTGKRFEGFFLQRFFHVTVGWDQSLVSVGCRVFPIWDFVRGVDGLAAALGL